jgi:putative MATE family efflux protein
MSNENIDDLTGDPKKALIKFAIPMIVMMFVQFSYQLVDTIFVAGLGANNLAAMGIIMPLFIIFMGIVNGMSAGATALVSRFIGAKDKFKADLTATHIVIIAGIVSIGITLGISLFLEPILKFLGATDDIYHLVHDYGIVFIYGTTFLVFMNILSAILRGEGNVQRSTYAVILSAIINIILDPILIYVFDMGIEGAAWASNIGMIISCIILIYWFITESYTDIIFKNFKFDYNIIKDFLLIGIPITIEFSLMSILAYFLNGSLIFTAGLGGISTYNAGWRLIMFSILPVMAFGQAVVPIVGAAFGAKKYNNIKIVRNYAIKLSVGISSIIATIIFILAPQISYIFTYADFSIYDSLITFFHYVIPLVIFLPLGAISTTTFQGLGKGIHSLFLTFIREILLILVFLQLFVYVFNFGILGVWVAITMGKSLGASISYFYTNYYLNKNFSKPEENVDNQEDNIKVV